MSLNTESCGMKALKELTDPIKIAQYDIGARSFGQKETKYEK